jgi:hypothetical protein
MYKVGADGIFHRCVLGNKHDMVLYEAHGGISGGHNTRKAMVQKVIRVGLWWP